MYASPPCIVQGPLSEDHWKKQQHKANCKHCSAGHGDRHECGLTNIRAEGELKMYTKRQRGLGGREAILQTLPGINVRRKSGHGESMTKFAKRQRKLVQDEYVIHSCIFLLWLQLGDAFMVNSPLLVILQFVDPNVLFRRVSEV
jgi:hypothetical protein